MSKKISKKGFDQEGLNRDENGQIFSLDALLAFIVITVIISVSANAMDLASFKIVDYSSNKYLDKMTSDAANILVNTPGSPGDWEYSASLNQVTPGLVEYNNGSVNGARVLGIEKINRLEGQYSDLMEDKIIPRGYHSSLIIYPSNPALKPIIVHDEVQSPHTSDVAVANRTVMVDFMKLNDLVSINPYFNNSLNIYRENSRDSCPHYDLTGVMKHQRPNFAPYTPGWTCAPFKVSKMDLNFTDFYLLSDHSDSTGNSARWILDRPENLSEDHQKFYSNSMEVNDRISAILGQDNFTVIWLHVYTSGEVSKSFNVHLVRVPKNTSPEKVTIDYLNPQPYFLVLKVWT